MSFIIKLSIYILNQKIIKLIIKPNSFISIYINFLNINLDYTTIITFCLYYLKFLKAKNFTYLILLLQNK